MAVGAERNAAPKYLRVAPPGLARSAANDSFQAEAWSTARLLVSRTRRAGSWTGADQIAECAFVFPGLAVRRLSSGSLEGFAETRAFRVETGDVAFFDLSRETPRLSSPANALEVRETTLWAPTERLPALAGRGSPAHGLVLKNDSAFGSALSEALQNLESWIGRLTLAELDLLGSAILDLTDRILATLPAPAPSAPPEPPLETFQTVRQYIEKNLAAPKLGPELLSKTFGLSRSSLYRLFEPVGGLSGYIKRARMKRVYDEITSPAHADRRIGPAAFALGFKNFSAFSRAFRQTYGTSPAEARRLALSGGGSPPQRDRADLSPFCRALMDLKP